MDIKKFSKSEWAFQSACLIQDKINAILLEDGVCSVMLTGGRSAERVYLAWADLPAFSNMTGAHFFFGDERCVPPDNKESNFGMAMRTLFRRGVPSGCQIFRMEADDPDLLASAHRYEVALPASVDILLLGLGDDGHIASLFPGSAFLEEACRKVVAVSGPKPPYERLTITPSVIAHAKAVFVFATGPDKAHVLEKILNSEDVVSVYPARLVMHAIWLLDTQLSNKS